MDKIIRKIPSLIGGYNLIGYCIWWYFLDTVQNKICKTIIFILFPPQIMVFSIVGTGFAMIYTLVLLAKNRVSKMNGLIAIILNALYIPLYLKWISIQ